MKQILFYPQAFNAFTAIFFIASKDEHLFRRTGIAISAAIGQRLSGKFFVADGGGVRKRCEFSEQFRTGLFMLEQHLFQFLICGFNVG